MEMGVAPQNEAARSSTWNSGMLRTMSTTRSPGARPSARKPAAAHATRWAYSPKVHERHATPSCQRRASSEPWAATVSKKADGMVLPAVTSSISWLLTPRL